MSLIYKDINPQEELSKADVLLIKNPYENAETSLQTNEMALKNLFELYKEFPNFNKAIQDGNKEKSICYLKCFAKNILEMDYDKNNPYDFIEFLFPYLLNIVQMNLSTDVLYNVLHSILVVIISSHYYSLIFVNSPAYQKLVQIIQSNCADDVTAISINIIINLSEIDDLRHIFHDLFPIEALVSAFLSNNYGRDSKKSFISIFSEYLSETTDREQLKRVFSSILQCLFQPNIDSEHIIFFFSIIGNFYTKHKEIGIDVIPNEMIKFLEKHILTIARHKNFMGTGDLFYFIYILAQNKINLYYPVEELYQIIIKDDDENQKRIKDNIILMFANSIRSVNTVEYSKQFLTNSLIDVINYIFEKGSNVMKNNGQLFIGCILTNDNLQLLLNFLKSPGFESFIYFVSNIDNCEAIKLSIGIIGSALHLLKISMPNSQEMCHFLSIISSYDILGTLNAMECPDEESRYLFEVFASGIIAELQRLNNA